MALEKLSEKSRAGTFAFLAAALLLITLPGCTTNPAKQSGDPTAVYDPLEEVNRHSFAVNDTLDQAIAQPIARGYRAVVPKFVRNSVSNFLRNLRSPINVANQVLQGDVEGAASDLSRAVINTSIGVGGLFDVAAETGLEYEHEDFGQTLAVWGIDHGPYLVVPFFGPSSFRDVTGTVVDTVADPLRIYLFNIDEEGWYYARVIASGIDRRTALLDVLDDLRKNSIDYYAAIRSSYMQRRDALVKDQDPDLMTAPAIPDYDD